MDKAIRGAGAGYLEVCAQIAKLQLPEPPGNALEDKRKRFRSAIRGACGLEDPVPRTVSRGMTEITKGLRNLYDLYSLLTAGSTEMSSAMSSARDVIAGLLATATDKFASYKEPGPDDCDSQSQDALRDAAVRAAWNLTRVRLGLSVRSDLFQRQRGFNPDHGPPDHPTPLPDGRLKDGEIRFEVSYARRGFEFVAGVGAGQSRLALADDLVGYISPSLSIAFTAASLSHDRLYDKDKDGEILHVVDGALPPHLVLGVDAQLQYAPSPPTIQVVKIQRVGVTGFADFRFTDKLAVRVGIPVAAELLARKSKVDGTEVKLDRQWSIPAFVATVLKL
jgi:hypothetical protein